MPRALVLMGSGETSPSMVTPHQKLLAPFKDAKRTILETPYGFQENADELTERIQRYFHESVGYSTNVARLRTSSQTPRELAEAISEIATSDWVFTGPGSPTYALQVWKESGAESALRNMLNHGTLVVSSAAALTVGTHTVPVYEIYKVGQTPQWQTGLDLLGEATGLKAAVIPHFNNAEGGTHDTRFCYIGERRLAILESQLPDDVFILGIDEHTGVSFDIDAQTASIFGRGSMTVRMGGQEWRVSSGETVTFAEIADHAGTRLVSAPTVSAQQFDINRVNSLLDSGNVNDAIEALLSLDTVERDIDTRAQIHALVTRLGQLAASPRISVEEIVSPYIDALLAARQSARVQGLWSEADAIRDKLIELKVIIKDSPEGSTWEIKQS